VSEIVLFLGGSRSGKSEAAESWVRDLSSGGSRVRYLATGEATDPEMEQRIARHRARRPADWDTWEGPPEALAEGISAGDGSPVGTVLLLDSLTTWAARRMAREPSSDGPDEALWRAASERILREWRGALEALPPRDRLVVVSDELGLGLIPETRVGRRFRDLLGELNQIAAAAAGRVRLCVAGLQVALKDPDPGNPGEEARGATGMAA
jgi:adenosylcobinamide kinase/adenosylcobinamide-phosphate guanylyltransferase